MAAGTTVVIGKNNGLEIKIPTPYRNLGRDMPISNLHVLHALHGVF